jgi:hypothetical protein
MSIFEDREKAAENAFEHDQELAFKIIARRNKLLGLWAAAQLGLAGESAARYAMDIVDTELTGHGDAAIVERICADFLTNGFPMTQEEVGRHLTVFAVKARGEVLHGMGERF